jgi:hypothetical protein
MTNVTWAEVRDITAAEFSVQASCIGGHNCIPRPCTG